MKWLIVIILAGALVWDVQSRWRAEQELSGMPWPNWMAAGDRADALQLVVGPLVVNVLLIAFFVSAAATGTRGEAPPLGSVLFTVLVFAGMFALSRRNRARVERGPVGPPLAQTRRTNRPLAMEQTASIALASQSFPGRRHAARLLGVSPALLHAVAVSLWFVGWASGFWYAASNF
jgi:hypothetical protein